MCVSCRFTSSTPWWAQYRYGLRAGCGGSIRVSTSQSTENDRSTMKRYHQNDTTSEIASPPAYPGAQRIGPPVLVGPQIRASSHDPTTIGSRTGHGNSL